MAQTCTVPGQRCTSAPHSSIWPCDEPVTVRELLGLGPPYYFGITPVKHEGGATKFDGMWPTLFDAETGFWGEFGPTTVERGATCFNKSQDVQECNWAGPSWPYETSRVLTGQEYETTKQSDAYAHNTYTDTQRNSQAQTHRYTHTQ